VPISLSILGPNNAIGAGGEAWWTASGRGTGILAALLTHSLGVHRCRPR
jgi:hypothetical protein